MPHHYTLLQPVAVRTGVLPLLVTLKRSLTATEGTLPGAFAFSAGTGTGSHRAHGAGAATPMAEARAEAEGTDVRA